MLKHLHRFTSAALSAALLLASGNAFAENLEVTSTTIGAEDYTSTYYTVFSDSYEVPVGSVLNFSFTNYTDEAEFYHNFIVTVAPSTTQSTEGNYFILRADAWGWGNSDYNSANMTNDFEWDSFKSEMNGAAVKVGVYNEGTTIYVSYDITSASGKKMKLDYHQAGTSGSFYSYLTLEKAHLANLAVTRFAAAEAFSAEANVPIYLAKDQTSFTMPTRGVTAKMGEARLPFGTATLGEITTDGKVTATLGSQSADAQFEFVNNCTAYGNADLTSGYGKVTDKVKVETGTPYTITYQVRAGAEENWHNVSVVLTNEADDAASTWLCRADNAAAITIDGTLSWVGDETVTNEILTKVTRASNWNWDIFKASIDGSVCTVTVTNNGDGTATVRYDVIDGNGLNRYQTFSNLTVTADDLYVYHTLEKAYMLVAPTAEEPVEPSAIKTVEQADVQIAVVAGQIVVSGADSFDVYDLQGRKVAAQGLKAGIYIVRAAGVAKTVVVK